MSEETRKVLQMLREGQVSVEEAERLLGALEEAGGSSPAPALKKASRERILRITIATGDGNDIQVNLPLSLAETALKFIPKEAMGELAERDIDLDAILEAIQQDVEGDIVNIQTGDGDDIRIYVD